jgi:hypothetical protein
MQINNQNTPSFGSRFIIRKFPLGEMVTGSGHMGALTEYSTRQLSKVENAQNTKMNKRIDRFVRKIQK